MTVILAAVSGLIIGGIIGFMACAILSVGKRSDECDACEFTQRVKD